MPVLHIEHRISDLDVWREDFASRAPAREQAAVTSVHVLQAEDDPRHIVELLLSPQSTPQTVTARSCARM